MKNKGPNHNELLSIQEAAAFLGVSRATFNKIRQELAIAEIMVGKRPRFNRAELLTHLVRREGKKAPAKTATQSDVSLNILSSNTVGALETKRNHFDLRLIKHIDPYGALSLLCTLLVRAEVGGRVELLIDDNSICQYLKTIQFFYHLERESDEKVVWNHKILQGTSIQDTSILMPINSVKLKGGERIIAENLLKLLRQQGFKDPVGRAISIILGELADNTMTHSHVLLSQRRCFISAKRFLWGESNCIIVGVADTGLGISNTLKQNKAYSDLTDKRALLEAFRPNVTSWENSPRGKGLTDVLSIALGNHSLLRVDAGELGVTMNLRAKNSPQIVFTKPMTEVAGTRFGLIVVDTDFAKTNRKEVDDLIAKQESGL